ncbi:MAG: ParB N-terminal domain-containing protein [Bacteroidaceae bacterium]|nr:ParB N-terminal domain-containing protein [Bacteroidaceae bacterium]
MAKTGKNTQMQPMTIRTLKISDIEEAFYNPRKVMKRGSKKYDNLKNSIEEFGYVEPMVVNEVNNRLISGHQRLNVLHDIGTEEVEVSIVHIEDEAREKAFNIALNKIKGKWDTKKLADVLKEIGDEWNALDLGFEESDIAEFLKNNDNLGVDGSKADEMDAGIKLRTGSAACVVAIAGVRFSIPADEFAKMEQGIIEAGIFSEKEISEELKRRFIAE